MHDRANFNFLRRDFWFGQVDSRPLSLFRILFAGWLLKDALLKLFLVDTFYTDSGVLPHATMSAISNPVRFTLLDLFTQTGATYALLGVWIVVLLLLMVGFRTTLMAFLNFVFVLSFLERNLFIGSAADTVFRVMSFWSMFVPLGHHYSVDSLRRGRQPTASRTAFAFPIRLLQLQFCLIYIFSVLIKLQYPAWATGNALFYSLQMSLYVGPLGAWFAQNVPYGVLTYLNYFTLFMEAGFALFMFAPVWQPTLRQLGLLLGVMLHVGIAVMMSIPNFSAVMILSYTIFFLPEWMDVFEKKVQAALRKQPALWQRFGRLLTAAETSDSAAQVPVHRQVGRVLLSLMLSVLLMWVVWWNIGTLNLTLPDGTTIIGYPQGLSGSIMRMTGLRQRWMMFTVAPDGTYGWVNVAGRFADETTRELLADGPDAESWYKAYDFTGSWRKYASNLWNARSPEMMDAFAAYFCQQFADQSLVSLDLIYNYRRFHAIGEPPNPSRQRVMLSYDCAEAI